MQPLRAKGYLLGKAEVTILIGYAMFAMLRRVIKLFGRYS